MRMQPLRGCRSDRREPCGRRDRRCGTRRTATLQSRPSGWLLTASAVDIAAVSFLAVSGVLMAPLGLTVVAALLGLAYLALLDLLKVPMFRALGFAPANSRK